MGQAINQDIAVAMSSKMTEMGDQFLLVPEGDSLG